MMTLTAEKKFLRIPVWVQAETRLLQIFDGAKQIYEFEIPVEEDKPESYYAVLPIEGWKGRELTIAGKLPDGVLEKIYQSDEALMPQSKKPAIHFAANAGWLNDPNGLLYQDGIYHLYFQYNPFDTMWGNMCWGHAVSRDLLKWTQLDTVLYPDEEGTVFSGCGLVNERKLLQLPENALFFPYTAAGSKSAWSEGKQFVQKLAYSLDGGATLVRKKGNIVDFIEGENRDPKVYWHEQSKGYYMVLYLDYNDFAILRSTDLEHWEQTQRLTLEEAWECPDLREIPVEEGGSRWIFWSADGFYFVGDFDGYQFHTDGIRREAYQTRLPYAAQTFWGCQEVITIPWLRTENTNKIYRGVMGLPKKLSLAQKDGALRLRYTPTEEYQRARKEIGVEKTEQFLTTSATENAIELQITEIKEKGFTGELFGESVAYHPETGKLEIASQTIFMGKHSRDFSVICDGEICEITAEQGFYYAAIELAKKEGETTLKIVSEEPFFACLYEIVPD